MVKNREKFQSILMLNLNLFSVMFIELSMHANFEKYSLNGSQIKRPGIFTNFALGRVFRENG